MKELDIQMYINDSQGNLIHTILVASHQRKPHYDEIFKSYETENSKAHYYRLGHIVEVPIKFEGREYTSIIKLDGRSVEFATTDVNEDGQYGSFSTCIPISSKEYREEYGTKASINFCNVGDHLKIIYISDLGDRSDLEVPLNTYESLLDDFAKWCYDDGISRSYHHIETFKGQTPVNGFPFKTIFKLLVIGTLTPLVEIETIKLIPSNIVSTHNVVLKTFKDVSLIREVTTIPFELLYTVVGNFITDEETLKNLDKVLNRK